MSTILAQIAPQRSTQYTALADALAPHELALSTLGPQILQMHPLRLAGQEYLRLELAGPPDDQDLRALGTLAMTSAFFWYHEQIEPYGGPFLRPIETHFAPAFSAELVLARRYKGKTNEMFTRFMCNIARFSSAFAREPWHGLRVLDPLAGGGTTLFTALMLGAEAAGVEQDAGDMQTTAGFVRDYLREEGIAFQQRDERLRKLGHRWTFTIGKQDARRLILAHGDTAQAAALLPGFRPHLIVTDLPYGFQHHGQLAGLLEAGLPVWASMLLPGGALVFSWDATRFSRPEMIALVQAASPLTVEDEPPYNLLAHRVDRAIKQRDVLVACRPAGG